MKVVALAVIFHKDKILIGRKRFGEHPMNLGGKWHVIGGKVEEGETEEEAVKREVKEETGLDVKVVKRLGEKTVKNRKGEEAKVVTFLCEAEEDGAVAKSDLIEVKWVRRGDFLKNICKESRSMLPENIESVLRGY